MCHGINKHAGRYDDASLSVGVLAPVAWRGLPVSLAAAKRAGERAEAAAHELLPWLRYVSDTTAEHYDAVVREPNGELAAGDVIEIKSAAVVIQDGRPGQFYLRQTQHDPLVAEEGWYLLVVCSPTTDREILTHRFVRAATLEADHIDSWWSGAGTRSDFRQLRWPHVIARDAVEGSR